MLYVYPFRTNTSYNFTTNVGGNNFRVHIKHNLRYNTYYMDIDMQQDGSYQPIISGINMTTGMDLLFPFKHYNLGILYIIPKDSRYYSEVPKAETITKYFYMSWEHD